MNLQRTFAAAACTTTLALTTACGAGGFRGAEDLPLPGGADLGSHPYRVTAQFADVLDLVPQAAVKVNDVAVGRVAQIQLAPDGWTAEVTMDLNRDVHLPADALAQLQQSSLLGEKYVQLVAPATDQQHGQLTDGAHIPIELTNRSPAIEEVLGALSMLLNGGGIGQIQDIVREVNDAMSGKETDFRQLLSNMDTATRTLDAQKADITHAIDGLNQLSASLAGQTGTVAHTLDHLGPGLQVLNQQRAQLVTMLQSLDTLSHVSVSTINRSRQDLVGDLQALDPTLQKLAQAGDNLPKSLQILGTFPFTDYALNDVKGDYANADLKLNLDLSSLLDTLTHAPPPAQPAPPPGDAPQPLPLLPLPLLPQPTPAPASPLLPPQGSSGGLLGGLLGGGS